MSVLPTKSTVVSLDLSELNSSEYSSDKSNATMSPTSSNKRTICDCDDGDICGCTCHIVDMDTNCHCYTCDTDCVCMCHLCICGITGCSTTCSCSCHTCGCYRIQCPVGYSCDCNCHENSEGGRAINESDSLSELVVRVKPNTNNDQDQEDYVGKKKQENNKNKTPKECEPRKDKREKSKSSSPSTLKEVQTVAPMETISKSGPPIAKHVNLAQVPKATKHDAKARVQEKITPTATSVQTSVATSVHVAPHVENPPPKNLQHNVKARRLAHATAAAAKYGVSTTLPVSTGETERSNLLKFKQERDALKVLHESIYSEMITLEVKIHEEAKAKASTNVIPTHVAERIDIESKKVLHLQRKLEIDKGELKVLSKDLDSRLNIIIDREQSVARKEIAVNSLEISVGKIAEIKKNSDRKDGVISNLLEKLDRSRIDCAIKTSFLEGLKQRVKDLEDEKLLRKRST